MSAASQWQLARPDPSPDPSPRAATLVLKRAAQQTGRQPCWSPRLEAESRGSTLRPIMKAQISAMARVMTDDARVYPAIGTAFASHESVNYSAKENARGDVTTNSVESSFAILKRGLYGTFHSVSEQHLQRYCTEFDFKWNTRLTLGFNDTDRTNAALRGIVGKRLTYRRSGSAH